MTGTLPASVTGSVARWAGLARAYDVPWTDLLLLALNVHGLRSAVGSRVRVLLRVHGDEEPRLVVVPSGRASSPFELVGDTLVVDGQPVATVERRVNDDAVAGYLRCWDGRRWRAATLNPNSRSRCTGCAFCPTALEDAVDPRLRLDDEIAALLAALATELPEGGSLTDLEDITISTGCFHTEAAALDHLRTVRRVLTEHGLHPRIGLLTSVVRSTEAFERIAEEVAPFVLHLTAECVSRRDILLKTSKASLRPEQMPDLLARARGAGLDTSFTYIVGLDPYEQMRDFLRELLPHVTVFPSVQVYQSHTALMDLLRAPGADDLGYYVRIRRDLEECAAPLGLVPERWRCYRPLWYTTFAGAALTGPCR
ncbi:hypothetical protein [Thermasporomyces composti]|jgi:hypothetical protein|uniref:Radical SAM family protein n=1 Tax=Thermasporomyces composti TaxID=696763 RepID=A0A3D9V424_THECX|nr:hypothetical protein [Thermasporomyces composti]REF36572.1 hypothetical protein DFJ64_1985 [Thermasporomyces composti]